MEDEEFLSNILLDGSDRYVPGLDDLRVPMTQDTQQAQDGEQVNVEAQTSRSTKGSKRTKNFDPKEDKVICSGWLNVSKDPINGANQNRTSFWKRVLCFFEKHKETTFVRTESSIMHRWLAIQAQVNKFCSCYEAIENRNQSGATIHDKISEALKMYQELDKDKKSFNLIPCWNISKGEDKWKAKMVEIAELEKLARQKKNKSSKVARPRDIEATNNEAATDLDAHQTEASKRPDGVKKAKEALKLGGGEACMEAMNMMWSKKEASDKEKEKAKEERFMASLEVDKAALELQKKAVENKGKLAEAKLLKEERETMLVDKTSLDPLQLQYIEIMPKKIIARRMEN